MIQAKAGIHGPFFISAGIEKQRLLSIEIIIIYRNCQAGKKAFFIQKAYAHSCSDHRNYNRVLYSLN